MTLNGVRQGQAFVQPNGCSHSTFMSTQFLQCEAKAFLKPRPHNSAGCCSETLASSLHGHRCHKELVCNAEYSILFLYLFLFFPLQFWLNVFTYPIIHSQLVCANSACTYQDLFTNVANLTIFINLQTRSKIRTHTIMTNDLSLFVTDHYLLIICCTI